VGRPQAFIYGASESRIEQITSGGTVTYLHHDQQGSTRLITVSSGAVEGKCTYGAYGTPTCEGTTTTPLGFDGQYTSLDTGLIYMRARVYDPTTAQFLTVDPMVRYTRAPYNYANDNPLNYADPSGLDVFEEAGEVIAGWGDKLTGGLTKDAREALGDENVDTCSSAYQAGGYAGLATAALIPVEGEEELGAEGIEDGVDASTPTGQRGSPMDVPAGANSPAEIDGLSYGGHALDEMQSEGFTPSVIQDAIANGEESVGGSGRIGYYSPQNNVTVVVEDGRVVTVTSGSVNIR
jgi:RHS repeat-associated protein